MNKQLQNEDFKDFVTGVLIFALVLSIACVIVSLGTRYKMAKLQNRIDIVTQQTSDIQEQIDTLQTNFKELQFITGPIEPGNYKHGKKTKNNIPR